MFKQSKSHWVFAYGSNMNLEDFKAWLASKGKPAKGILQYERATLPGFSLIWNYYSKNRNGGAANVQASDRNLPGLALQVDEVTLKAIDQKEGHPNYYSRGDKPRKVLLQSGKEVLAWVYIALPECCSVHPVWPTRNYLQLLISAAKTHCLPSWHIEDLQSTQTAD